MGGRLWNGVEVLTKLCFVLVISTADVRQTEAVSCSVHNCSSTW